MATVAKLTQDGELRLSGGINTRLPLITDGLVAHYPMDGRAGTIDIINGNTPIQNTLIGVNLLDAIELNWRNPLSWESNYGITYDSNLDAIKVSGYHNTWLKTPIVIDPSKEYQISIDIMETTQSSTGLYIGGYSLDALGVRATTNYDYTLAANDQPVTNVWKTYRLTRTGTSTASSSTSTSFANIKGWTGDAGKLIKYYHFGALFNYSSGGELYAKNLKIEIIDSDNSNTTLTNDGIAIENATVNYLSSGISGYNAKDINHWAGTNTYGVDEATGNQTIVWNSASGAYTYTHDYVLDDDLTTLSGQTVTFSLMLRRKEGTATGQIRVYDDKSGYSFMSVAVDREFKKFSMTKTIGVSPTRIFVMIDNTGGGTYEFYDCQLEIGSIATEYVDGSRSASGKFTVLNPVKTGEFTISYDWKSNSPVGTSSSYQTSFSMGTYYTNNSFTIMDANSASTGGAQRLIRKGNAGEWAWIDADLTSPSTFQDWTTITIVRNATYYRVYSNGIYKGQLAHSSATMQDYIHVGSRESWRTGENSSTRNLSIYNRALSDDEITKITKGTHSFTKTELITNSISTRNNTEGTTFNFDSDGMDYNKYIIPTKDDNTVYENSEGGVWIGSGTTNLYGDYLIHSLSSFGNQLGTNSVFEVNTDINYNGNNTIKVIRGSGNRIYRTFSGISGNTVTATMMVYSEIPGSYLHFEASGGDYSWGVGYTRTTHTGKGWEILKVTTSAPLTSNTTMYLMLYPVNNNTLETPLFIGGMQAENSPYPTPFVNGTRPESSLHLPYNIIDCKKDFTIYGWMKPVTLGITYQAFITRNIPDSNDTGNRILFMTNNTSGNMHLWYGSGGTETTLSGPSTKLIANEWNFCCLSRSGSNINIYVGNSSGFGKTSKAVGTYLNSDESNQVWQIGEYNNTESDAYHRDYSFIQRGLNDSEIEAVFKTKMSAKVSGLTMNGINTTATL